MSLRLGRHFTIPVLAATLGLTSTGCSLLFVKGPHPEVEPPPKCTTSNVAPAVDVVGAVITAGIAGIAFAEAAHCSSTPDFLCNPVGDWWATAGVSAAIAALYTASAVVGFTRTAACSESGLESFQTVVPQAVPRSSLVWLPEPRCPEVGDVPRLCSSLATSGVLKGTEATVRAAD